MKYLVLVVGAILAISLAATTPVMAGNCDALPMVVVLLSLSGGAQPCASIANLRRLDKTPGPENNIG
jgi:hypothetical protein